MTPLFMQEQESFAHGFFSSVIWHPNDPKLAPYFQGTVFTTVLWVRDVFGHCCTWNGEIQLYRNDLGNVKFLLGGFCQHSVLKAE